MLRIWKTLCSPRSLFCVLSSIFFFLFSVYGSFTAAQRKRFLLCTAGRRCSHDKNITTKLDRSNPWPFSPSSFPFLKQSFSYLSNLSFVLYTACVRVGNRMQMPSVIVILPLGLLFLLSGLIVNLIQAILYVLIRPMSKNMYRRFNKAVAELLWLELVWLFDWWAGMKVELHVDPETFHLMGNEHALLISNHRSDIDWLVGWVLSQRSGCLGSSVAIMKKVLKYLPVIGWSMWFSEYVFLERSWAKDESTLKSGFEQLKDFPNPFWLALFVEGTRFTQGKLSAAQQYAISRGLPIPRKVLLPRTKGFVSAVKHTRSFIPAIYDATLTVAKDYPPPTMLTLFKGQSSVVKVHIKRHFMHELPETSDDIAQWCRNMFMAKDAFLENYFASGRFGTEEIQDIGLPKKSLIVMIVWSCLLVLGAVEFLSWTSLFSTWEGIALSAAFLLLVVILMQVLILFSQSEPSAPVDNIQEDLVREHLLKQ